jgi:hypothetical protein
MGSFQVCDALNILFKLETPHVKHFEGFILLLKEGGELQKNFRTLDQKFQLKNLQKFPIGSAKVGTMMVEGMFVIITMSC